MYDGCTILIKIPYGTDTLLFPRLRMVKCHAKIHRANGFLNWKLKNEVCLITKHMFFILSCAI